MKTTIYVGIVDEAEDGSLGVVFPDLPGCTSAGRNLDDLAVNSREAARLWADTVTARGLAVPAPRDLTDYEMQAALREAGAPARTIRVPLVRDVQL